MDDLSINTGLERNEINDHEVSYNTEKDFYKGIGGELRFKAEGLFKKAKEKGISIEDIEVTTMKESSSEFPGLGLISLPALLIKVRGRHIQSGQIITDGKQIDYYNRYQQYIAEKIQYKSSVKDEKGGIVKENKKPVIKEKPEYTLTDWELFEVGRDILDDKEFGLEKTITGACDRVIRKLMGENDWLYPGEARMLDEEFSSVQKKLETGQNKSKGIRTAAPRKATERQINYLKAKIKNLGADPYDDSVIREVIKQSGFESADIGSLSTGDVSKIIDSINIVMPKVREALSERGSSGTFGHNDAVNAQANLRQ